MKVVALISGGKDSCFNMMHCSAMGHEIVALANLQPKHDGETDSFMYQSVGHEGISLYAKAMQLPLYTRTVQGTSKSTGMHYEPDKDDEVEDLYELLKEVKDSCVFDAVSCGAILSDYQRIRVEGVCTRLNLKSLTYLWRQDQKTLLNNMINAGLDAILIKVAALGLNQRHLGKSLKSMQAHLLKLNSKYGCHVCGEGGEYETFTLDCPLFKQRIMLDEHEVVVHSDDDFAPVLYLRLKSFRLEEKNTTPYDLSYLVPKPCLDKTDINKTLPQLGKVTPYLGCDAIANNSASYKCFPTTTVHNHFCFISGIIGSIKTPCKDIIKTDIQNCAMDTFSTMSDLLKENSHDLKDVCYIHLYISDMEHFTLVNSVYKTFFNSNPPARVCVGLQLSNGNKVESRVLLSVDCVSWKREQILSKVMHVQGISHWAPANIGPYSQCVQRGNLFFVAGQIGLVPGTMELVVGGIWAQGSLSLQHVKSVLTAMEPSFDYVNIAQCVCYVTDSSYVEVAKIIWEKSACDCPELLDAVVYVVVPSLPKHALIEWQVIAAKQGGTTCTEPNDTNDANMLHVIMKHGDVNNDLKMENVLQQLLNDLTRDINKYQVDDTTAVQTRLFYAASTSTISTIEGFCSMHSLLNVACVPVESIYIHNAPNPKLLAAFSTIL